MQEGLKHVSGLGDGDHAGGARVVDAIVEVVHAAGVHNLLAADVRAGQLAHACPELRHRAVVLRAAKQAHVRVGQALGHGQALAVGAHESACKVKWALKALRMPSHAWGCFPMLPSNQHWGSILCARVPA